MPPPPPLLLLLLLAAAAPRAGALRMKILGGGGGHPADRRSAVRDAVSVGLGLGLAGMGTTAAPQELIEEAPLPSAAANAQAGDLDFRARAADRAHVFMLRRGGFGGKGSPFAAPLALSSSMEELAASDLLFLGEHHDSDEDHRLQASMVRQLQNYNGKRKIGVGLEMVQAQFQPVLDAYTAGKITDAELFEQTQWADRWRWPFESYLPLLHTVRDMGGDLVALNTNSESIRKVESAGLGGLSRAEVQQYVCDPDGFARTAADPVFLQYVKGLLLPSYLLHAQMGVLRASITGDRLEEDITFANFFAARILWDETMATRAVRYIQKNPGAQLVVVAGGDHVRYGYGIPVRAARIAPALGLNRIDVKTAMLNPTDVAQGLAAVSRLELELPREREANEDPLPWQKTPLLADYLVYSRPLVLKENQA
uniref:Haem-binding uptake Tiki superfamily ChaN domain-containing protein n=1 Tax=Phaeomonas parva TaxID=124430 RepID=A0A6U4GZF2_9STRA